MKKEIDAKILTYISLSYSTYKNKINGQIEAWKKRGFHCFLLSIETTNNGCYILVEYQFDSTISSSIIAETKNKKTIYKELSHYILKNYDKESNIIYIRRLGINLLFFGPYIKGFKSKVLYEIPTYPIDSGTNFIRKIALMVENFYFYKFIYSKITGIPVFKQSLKAKEWEKFISLENSVVVSDVYHDFGNQNNTNYSFLFFGNLQDWHGIEKFIDELNRYEGDNIFLNLYSSNTDSYKKLVQKYKNSKNIKFNQSISFEDLENKLVGNVIGIGGLNYESRGAELDTSLKNKDYAALGIPFIYKLPDLSFQDYSYALKISDSDFDGNLITKIIDWYDSIYFENLNNTIKDYARINLTYDKQIDRIIRKLEI